MYWNGTKEHDRFPAMYPDSDEVFQEYMSHSGMLPSRFEGQLAKSSGLLELHYDTMRKRQKERSKNDCFVAGPTMTRPFTACVGYSGFIPGKESNNICGCTFAQGSRLSKELRPLSWNKGENVFTLGRSSRSWSSPSLNATDAFARTPPRTPSIGGERTPPLGKSF
jgi:hypothetical protein